MTASAGQGVRFGSAKLPAGIPKEDETIYYGRPRVTLPLLSRGRMSSGTRFTVTVWVSYQLCQSAAGVCLPPQRKRFTLPVTMPSGDDSGTKLDICPVPPDLGNNNTTDSGDFSGYRGVNSGKPVKYSKNAPAFGAATVSHALRKISVKNRVRIVVKAKPGTTMSLSVYCWKKNLRKWQHVYAPRKFVESLPNGKTLVELFLPGAGRYIVSFQGNYKKLRYKDLLTYYVTARESFPEEDVPARPVSKFYKDGFRLVSHTKGILTGRNEMTITIKGLSSSWLYADLRDEKTYKTYYSPWQIKEMEKKRHIPVQAALPQKRTVSSLYLRSKEAGG